MSTSSVLYEQVVPGARPNDATGAPRLDVLTKIDGRTVFIDVAVTHALGRRPMSGGLACRKDGAAAEIYERYKHSLYPGVAVTPAILEAHGRPGEALIALVRGCTAHLQSAERSSAIASIWQSISVTLQNHNAKMITTFTP